MRNVKRLKEVRSLRELRATPDVPSTRVPFGRVPDAVQRLQMKRAEGNADFLRRVRLNRNHANAFTTLPLRFGRRHRRPFDWELLGHMTSTQPGQKLTGAQSHLLDEDLQRLIRVRGQLMFDASHGLCENVHRT